MSDWESLQAQSLRLASELAALLPGYRAVPAEREYGWARVLRDDGAGFFVRMGSRSWGDGRVVLSPVWPQHADGRPYTTPARYHAVVRYAGRLSWSHPQDEAATTWSITVAAGRAPKAIARDVVHRMLPAYLVMYAVALEEVATTNGHTDEAAMAGARLADVLGQSVRGRTGAYQTGERVELTALDLPLSRIHVSPAYNDNPVRVSFEVHNLDPETAAKVFAIIREAKEEKAPERARVMADAPARIEIEAEEEDPDVTPALRVVSAP